MFHRLVSPIAPRSRPIPGGPAPDPLHGSFRSALNRAHAEEAAQQAQALLDNEGLARLLTTPRERQDTPRARDVFVNRNLRMASIDLIGFDMDYTLAIYHMRRLEQLSFDMTLTKLVSDYGYPPVVGGLLYDHHFVMRGLAVDRATGNILKMDRFGHVGRVWHGLRPIKSETKRELYRNKRIRPSNPRFAWNDTLFALPETCLYAGIIELMESLGERVDYGKLYDNIREAIDTVHRDNSLKREVRKDLARYVFEDPELGPALHKLRSGGKRLFLLTNSAWDYTDAVMGYLLDGKLPEYPSWRNYFDFTVTAAGKPGFFMDQRPFLELDTSTEAGRVVGEAKSLERGKVYSGGNLVQFEDFTGYRGDNILYVGDHIYGDILKSKKSSLWRTCMVVQEIEDEITYTDSRREEITQLSEVELTRARLDDTVNVIKSALNTLERRLERGGLAPEEQTRMEEERKRLKHELDTVRRALKDATGIADTLERDVEEGFNPYWGLLFKEGNENSRFGYQVEQYACLYTSRVSNFLHYSPMQYYRSPRDLMPHEQAGALSGKLSPLGSEGPPKASSKE
ncbi:HAD-IG family 5'-nucleotidase [Stigmatella sp. ncwal1]|uniref:HAD-IG family 5'-nucleotidase n=1 Tax=Stigmatella ashevillensis TaxID=2995309 RepID=A0ABT5CZK2_9BACT|nr:HAD-IG family 5'-nucleotidase [Stigmatella ashevillena]MDC0706857.1 HAD-IG family 5'-nucleotidase [Stigmatella ashevillena]